MTFPSALKKSRPITISKTGSGSKASSPGSPRSPASPLNTSVKKIVSETSVKVPPANKPSEKTSVVTSVKKVAISSKSSASKSAIKPVIDVKSESVKTPFSATKGVTKSVTKPPPLNLSMKLIDVNGLQSPVTPKSPLKSIPKTPTTLPIKKSPTLTKSMPTNSVSAAKSPLLSGVKSPSSPLNKLSKVSTVALVTKSQVSSETKSSAVKSTSKSSVLSSPVTSSKISGSSKASTVCLPVAKCLPLVVPKTSKITTAPKSPLVSIKPATPTVKSIISKTVVKENSLPLPLVQSKAIIVKPTTPVKKADVLSTKNVSRVKLPITTNKPTITSKSPSTVLGTKVITLKPPSSPSKLLKKEPSTVKIANNSTVATKSNVSKSGPASKVTLNKETSTYSLSSGKSSLLLKSTTSNVTVTSSIAMSKNLVPKSPITRPLTLTVAKSPSSPTAKTSPSPIVKTLMSPTVKSSTPLSPTIRPRTPLSPIARPRTTSISSKPTMSPAKPKLLPTKLILSPTKSKLSPSSLNSTSTENLASRTSLKSPMSPKPLKFVPKSLSKIIKKIEVPTAKSIRGGQPIQKTIVIPEIYELSTNKVIDLPEASGMCKLENLDKNNFEEMIESAATETSNLNLLFLKTMEINKTEVNIEDDLKTNDAFIHDDLLLNATMLINADNGEKPLNVQEQSVGTKEEKAAVAFSSIVTPKEQKQDENSCSLLTKDECKAHLNSKSQSANNCNIVFDDHNFNTNNENIVEEQLEEAQLCIQETEDNFETMNDKLVLGDVPFESDISDCEQFSLKEPIKAVISDEETKSHCVGDVFLFTNTEDLSFNDLDRADSTANFIHQFMPKSVDRSEGASSISTDDGSLLSPKSYSEAVVGSPKDNEFYFAYDFDLADDCLDYDDERSVFVEVTEKEFPELKPKDLSCKRKNKKQKKRTCSNRTESQSGNYNLFFMLL